MDSAHDDFRITILLQDDNAMQVVEFTNGLLTFIENSPTPFHAVENMVNYFARERF